MAPKNTGRSAPTKEAPKATARKTATAAREPAGRAVEKAAPRAPRKTAPEDVVDLSALARMGKAHEDDIRAQMAGNNTWIKIIQPGMNELVKDTKEFIEAAQAGDFAIPEHGAKEILRVTPIGLFKVYALKKPAPARSDNKEEMDQTVAFWFPEDAEQIPLAKGDNFKRVLPDGRYLQPMHWMFIYIHEFPGIKDALIPFQSIGNKYYNTIAKMVKKESSLCTELILDLHCEGVPNEEFHKTYFYPLAEVQEKRNFIYDPDSGDVTTPKGCSSPEVVADILTRYAALQKEYAEGKTVSRQSPQQLLTYAGAPAQVARRGLPGGAGAYQDEASDGPGVKF